MEEKKVPSVADAAEIVRGVLLRVLTKKSGKSAKLGGKPLDIPEIHA